MAIICADAWNASVMVTTMLRSRRPLASKRCKPDADLGLLRAGVPMSSVDYLVLGSKIYHGGDLLDDERLRVGGHGRSRMVNNELPLDFAF